MTDSTSKMNDDKRADHPSFLHEILPSLFAPDELRLFKLRSLLAFVFFVVGKRIDFGNPPTTSIIHTLPPPPYRPLSNNLPISPSFQKTRIKNHAKQKKNRVQKVAKRKFASRFERGRRASRKQRTRLFPVPRFLLRGSFSRVVGVLCVLRVLTPLLRARFLTLAPSKRAYPRPLGYVPGAPTPVQMRELE